MSERKSEAELRGNRTPFGVRITLMDGAHWTIPPMPLHGAQHQWFKAKCKAFEKLVEECQQALTAYNKALVDAVKEAGDEGEPDLTAADEIRDAAAHFDDDFIVMGLDLTYAAMKLNYPELDRERDFAGLIATQHLIHVWQIVNGQKETQDLFPDDGSDPPIV